MSLATHAGLVALGLLSTSPAPLTPGARHARQPAEALRWVRTPATPAAAAPARGRATARRAGARGSSRASTRRVPDGAAVDRLAAAPVSAIDLGAIALPDVAGDALVAQASDAAFDRLASARDLAVGTPPAVLRGPDHTYRQTELERVPLALPSNPAIPYPTLLLGSGVGGEVFVRFVIDSTGRPEAGSVTVLAASHPAFARAVRQALPRMRFLPGEVAGHAVRVLVEQPYRFVVR